MTAKQPKSMTAQHQKFIQAARQTGCDEADAAFDARLRQISKATPDKKPKKKP